ncbi:MAG: nickel-dependent hydrogenase large subunit, partial [Armatimonadetes bacterium]|nr:nickel-dependent hydrogenase large subunit [Armatimonadota bacterium]
MTTDANIHVHHVTRVEGHGDIEARISGGQLREVRFAIVEAPRFFEGFLRGLAYPEVVHIASRICGICACSHKSAALKATEVALGVEISEQSEMLRRLAYHGETLSSHLLHIYFLAAPDFLGLPSVMPLIHTDPDLVRRAMRLKQIGYDLASMVAGRHTHPIAMCVGGFTFTHDPKDLLAMRERLVAIRADLEFSVELFGTLELPQLERETESVSLKHPDRYAFYDGDLCSSEGILLPPSEYKSAIEEYVVPHSTAKHARWNRPEYMVGALARFNNNHEQLHPVAKQAAEALGLQAPCNNPFMITVAQLVECVHCVEDAIELIDALVERGIKYEDSCVE